tara:strand:- start:190 stop:321 length:132 start_codon:yes stop_codon:yes gene_type:complete
LIATKAVEGVGIVVNGKRGGFLLMEGTEAFGAIRGGSGILWAE